MARALTGEARCNPEILGVLMRDHSEELAVLVTSEQGKPLPEAPQEIVYAAGFLDWFAAEGERAYGETIPGHKLGTQLHVRMQPIGVAAAIAPWNFPVAMITRKAGAALAAGCPMVVKPAPETPLSALAVARLAEQAGVPAGVFQVLIGDTVELSAPLLHDARIRALSFTGSTHVGRLLLRGRRTRSRKCRSNSAGALRSSSSTTSISTRLSSHGCKIRDLGPGSLGR